MTREELLPLLQQCVAAPDAAQLSAAAVDALRSFSAQLEPAHAELERTADAMQRARTALDVKLLAARALRELVQIQRAMTPETPEPAPPTHKERARARVERAQTKALHAHRQAPGRPVEQPVETIPGVGESLGQALRARGLRSIGDLIWLLPTGYLDERTITRLDALVCGQRQVSEGIVVSARSMGGGRNGRMAEVWLNAPDAGSGQLRLTWFRAPPGLLARFLPGMRYRVAGLVESFRGQPQMTHPETQRISGDDVLAPRGVVPRYPVVAGVPPRKLASFVNTALQRAAADIDEAVPPALRAEHGIGTLAAALKSLHTPPAAPSNAELAAWNNALTPQHARLAFEEFFLLELALFRRRVEDQGILAEPLVAQASPIARVREALGFELTGAQQRVTQEIFADMAGERPMRRLLQGDVGCGKTAVAMLAAAQCVAAGAQVAFMAPTEVLAEQHYRALTPLLAALGLRAALVLGGARASHRKKTRKGLEDGTLDLAVGTHALLSEGVRFARLRLVIIDEQHRFGVGQRLRLVDKGGQAAVSPHLLVMTATPIPRTLSLALHGDLEASVIDELPAGRVPPVTRAYELHERERALVQLERALSAGGQAYVVCPSIEESDELPLAAVEKTHAELAIRFAAHGVELLHGRLRPEQKQQAMERFVSGQARVLVATTIIEVGIDVARANVILIENAERFGLAQLHQLRGRVGRAGQRSACLLVHQAVSDDSRSRLAALCETADGFRIAEEDLRLRGPGELFGHRQSGLPGFRFGDLRRDAPLLGQAREAAQRVIAVDPELALPEHAAARRALARWNEGVRSVVKEEAG